MFDKIKQMNAPYNYDDHNYKSLTLSMMIVGVYTFEWSNYAYSSNTLYQVNLYRILPNLHHHHL